MIVSLSVPPVSIWLSGGYLNWKLYLELVKSNQLLVGEVAVAVTSGVTPIGVGVGVAPGSSGVEDGTGDTTGVGVGVVVVPRITTLAPTKGSSVRRLSPLETRALHSTADWPAFKPVRLNVNTVPSVVALLPLLPAMATMKLPFCGPLIAVAGSAPNRSATEMLLTSRRLAS